MPALTLKDRLAMLEKIAGDESVKVTQRLRAMEEIGRIESRLQAASGKADEPGEGEMAPDPMADLDEMEQARQRRLQRQRRAAGA